VCVVVGVGGVVVDVINVGINDIIYDDVVVLYC